MSPSKPGTGPCVPFFPPLLWGELPPRLLPEEPSAPQRPPTPVGPLELIVAPSPTSLTCSSHPAQAQKTSLPGSSFILTALRASSSTFASPVVITRAALTWGPWSRAPVQAQCHLHHLNDREDAPLRRGEEAQSSFPPLHGLSSSCHPVCSLLQAPAPILPAAPLKAPHPDLAWLPFPSLSQSAQHLLGRPLLTAQVRSHSENGVGRENQHPEIWRDRPTQGIQLRSAHEGKCLGAVHWKKHKARNRDEFLGLQSSGSPAFPWIFTCRSSTRITVKISRLFWQKERQNNHCDIRLEHSPGKIPLPVLYRTLRKGTVQPLPHAGFKSCAKRRKEWANRQTLVKVTGPKHEPTERLRFNQKS